MDVASLSAKQARIRSWSEFLSIEGLDEGLRQKIAAALETYRNVLVRCWEVGNVDASHAAQLHHLEHELETLNERVRLTLPRTLGREYEK